MVRYYHCKAKRTASEYIVMRRLNVYVWYSTQTPDTINDTDTVTEEDFFSAVNPKQVPLKYIKLNGYYENFKRYYQQHK